MNFVVWCGADRIVSGLEPLETDERKPAVGLEEVRFVLLAPGSVLFLPGSFLRDGGRGQQRQQKGDESQAGRTIPEVHEKVYRVRENTGNEEQVKEQACASRSLSMIVYNEVHDKLLRLQTLTKSIF